jgi:hypothetical protein
VTDRFLELVQALQPRPWVAQLHPEQLRIAQSFARWKAVTTSRRWGKTVLLSALAAESLEESRHDETSVYIARTRGVAKELVWGKLHALDRQHGLGWTFQETTLRVESRRGGVLLVRGAEGGAPGEELDKLRGPKMRRALVDEPATYARTLGMLLRDVLEPALGDLRGDCIVAGTPGIVCAGTWHELSTGARAKWSRWAGDIRGNPHFPDADEYLAGVCKENGWTEDHPTFQREYLGRWTVDEEAQVYRYLASRNDVHDVPGYDRAEWVHTIGVDFGMVDSTAWVVLASHPHHREVYVVEAFKRAGLLPEQTSEITAGLVRAYDPHCLVGDSGGLGRPYVSHYNSRHYAGAQMVAAEKLEKRAHIELLNGDLRAPRLFILRPACDALVEEIVELPWADEQRLRPHPDYEDHLLDAMLYAWRHHHAFMHSKPAARVNTARQTPDDPAYVEREREALRAEEARDWWNR